MKSSTSGSRVYYACSMRPLDYRDNARRNVEKFAVFRRNFPEQVVAVVVKRDYIRDERGLRGPWAVETPAGLPLLKNERFGCRQAAYKAFMAGGSDWAQAIVSAMKAEARRAA